MRIKSIKAYPVDLAVQPKTKPRTEIDGTSMVQVNPLSRYPDLLHRKNAYAAQWKNVVCIATADDGTWGMGISIMGGPAAKIINDLFSPLLVGQECSATEKCWDAMVRASAAFGAFGLASYAISAVDTALWDLKGKLLNCPVYELLGGPQKDRIFCYATGPYTEWYLELGFKAVKIFTPFGPDHGIEGINRAEELTAAKRELVGDDVELMFDCWLSLDVAHTVRLAERLRPYHLKWIEDYLPADDFEGYAAVRKRLPWQTLATGEHWYLPPPFSHAAGRKLVDILQPDVLWAGGVTAIVKICHLAESAGISVITHAGMNYPYGQHLAFAMPAIPWGERSESVSPPGVPLEEMVKLPGTPVVQDGYLIPSNAPGFGIEVDLDWIEARVVS